jgi:cation transport ATPase
VIETLGKVDTIAGKTGTITHHKSSLVFLRRNPERPEKQLIKTITSHSTHPLSKMMRLR